MSLLDTKHIDKRAILKELHKAKKTGKFPGDPKAGEALLNKAKQEHLNRIADSNKNIDNWAHEAASYVRNRARERISVIGGGLGDGYSLGSGRWRFENGGWRRIK